MRLPVVLLLLAGCGFQPAYEGEPQCGRVEIVHAVEGEPCAEVAVACDCAERRTLKCIEGQWTYAHQLCQQVGLSQ